MFRSFDIYGQYETPQLILANPNGEELAVISNCTKPRMILNFCGYSELFFDVPSILNNGEEVPYYKLLQQTRLVKVEGFGVFVISSVVEEQDGIIKYKEVSCKTIDSLFSVTSIVALDDTIRLYEPSGTEQTICSMFLNDFPDWKIGYVDNRLYDVFRTYDITEDNWYNFLYNSVRNDFECVVKADTITKTISFHSMESGLIETDVFFSFENVIKKLNIETVEDGIQTALEVYGGNGLSIHDVNPLGTSVIYNFSYYKNTDWIRQDTVDAITKWENLVKSKTVVRQNLIAQLRNLNKQLVTLKANLTDVQTEYDSVEIVLSARAEMKYDTTEQKKQLDKIMVELNSKKKEIANCETQIKSIKNSLLDMKEELSFEKNFTSEQLIDLKSILRKGTYSNDAYAITDSMTTEEILEVEDDLMATAQNTLNKVCNPRYTINSELVNILALEEFNIYASQLELGCYVTMQIDEDTFAKLVLMRYEIEFDDKTSVKITFSNGTNLNDGMTSFAELFDGMQSTISSLSTNNGIYKKFVKSGADDEVQKWKTDALDLAQKNILSSSGQSVSMNGAGLWLRKTLSDGSYDPKQTLMVNNSIVMTDSGWTGTPKLAMGEIVFNGVTHYGIATDLLVGNIVATSSLIIKNSNNSFILDAKGFKATDADISLKRSDGASEIYLNPTEGIKIRTKVNGVAQDVFYVDSAGNLNFKGNLTGATGTFSGNIKGASFTGGSINIGNGKFVVDSAGNCKASSINISGGGISGTTISGNTISGGTIKGTTISGSTIKGNTITGGTIEGSTIKGNTITGGSISGTTITGSIIKGATIEGGDINVDDDVTIGSYLYLQGNNCGVVFKNASSGFYSYNGNLRFVGFGIELYSDTQISGDLNVDFDITAHSIETDSLIVDGSYVATEDYVDDEVDEVWDLTPWNAVFNSSSGLLKFFAHNGDLLFDVYIDIP